MIRPVSALAADAARLGLASLRALAQQAALPEAMRSTCSRDAIACTKPASDGRLKVERCSVRMHHASCTFDRIRIVADGIFEGRGTCIEARGGRGYRGGISLMGLGDRMMARFPDRRDSPDCHRCSGPPLPVR